MTRIIATGYTPQEGADSTPVGQTRVTADTPGKYEGTDGADKATLDTVARDTDGVIKLGAGDDVFIFGVGDENSTINGVVSMGGSSDADNGGTVGGNFDRVFLTHKIEDYSFTIRSGEGIKIHYVADLDGDGRPDDGAAVTFYGADQFVFRNFDSHTGQNFANTVMSYDQLIAAIQGAQAGHTLDVSLFA